MKKNKGIFLLVLLLSILSFSTLVQAEEKIYRIIKAEEKNIKKDDIITDSRKDLINLQKENKDKNIYLKEDGNYFLLNKFEKEENYDYCPWGCNLEGYNRNNCIGNCRYNLEGYGRHFYCEENCIHLNNICDECGYNHCNLYDCVNETYLVDEDYYHNPYCNNPNCLRLNPDIDYTYRQSNRGHGHHNRGQGHSRGHHRYR